MFDDAQHGDIVEYEGKRWRVTVIAPGCAISYCPPGSTPKRRDMKRQIGLTEVRDAEAVDYAAIHGAVQQAFRDTLVRVDALACNEDGDHYTDRQEGWMVNDFPMDVAMGLVAAIRRMGYQITDASLSVDTSDPKKPT